MNAAVWTNKQHLALRLAPTHDVFYVESMGLRRPKIALEDAKRIFQRIFKASGTRMDNRHNEMVVIKPHVLPYHANALISRLNGYLIRRQVRRLLAESPSPTLLWSFSPITYGIEDLFDSVVYHSVDLLHELEGLPKQRLLEDERSLVANADAVIASSAFVQSHMYDQGASNVNLWENVADTELYSSVQSERTDSAVFAGNLTPGKVDFNLLTKVADAGVEVMLAGPYRIDGVKGGDALERLLNHPKVTYHGNLAPNELALLLNSCTVGLIPYHQNPYTLGVFPMKVYEYLASGLSVVATPLPSLLGAANSSLELADGDKFVSAVLTRIRPSLPEIEANRRLAVGHSWTARADQANALIEDLGERRG